MTLQKIAVPMKSGRATVCCPECKSCKDVNVPAKAMGKDVVAKCIKCKGKFLVSFYNKDRAFFRKECSIEGIVALAGSEIEVATVIIADLSCQGAKFNVRCGTASFKKGELIGLKFTLPDNSSTEIRLNGKICRVNQDGSYSVEFKEKGEFSPQKKSIGFWMR